MAPFDPYHQWLGIPPGEQPPDHYRLLGVPLLESDLDVIEAAAQRQTVFLRTLQLGPQSELAEQLLNEVARARVTLLVADQKAVYDDKLRKSLPTSPNRPPPFNADVLSAEVDRLREQKQDLEQDLQREKESFQQLAVHRTEKQQAIARDLERRRQELEERQVELDAQNLALQERQEKEASRWQHLAGQLEKERGDLQSRRNEQETLRQELVEQEQQLEKETQRLEQERQEAEAAHRSALAEQSKAEREQQQLEAARQAALEAQSKAQASAAAAERQRAKLEKRQHQLEREVTDREQEQDQQHTPRTDRSQTTTSDETLGPRVATHRRSPSMEPATVIPMVVGVLKSILKSSSKWFQRLVIGLTKSILISVAKWFRPRSHKVGLVVVGVLFLIVLFLTKRPPLPHSEGLIAYYPFNGNAKDKSGNRNDGAVHGATPAEDRFGNVDCAYEFDGVDDNIVISEASQFEAMQHTLSFWVKADTWFGDILSKDGELSERQWLVGSATRDGRINAHVGTSPVQLTTYRSKSSLAVDDWYHIAQVWDGSLLTLFIDGVLDGSLSATGSPQFGNQPVRIGGGAPAGRSQFFFSGFIDDVRIYNRALSDAEVKALYNFERTPPLAVAPFKEEQAKQHQHRWADYLETEVEVSNDIGMTFVLIPPGEFMMGSPETEEGRFENETQHLVRITKPFYLSAYEVTQAQYQKVMDDNPSSSKGATRPVETVNWNDAIEFCRTLSKKEGVEYRLPTEAEWEYACRAGTTTAYSFGDDVRQLPQYAWCGDHAKNITHPVGEKLPNAWGLFGMHGNVREWCQDRYGPYESLKVLSDPTGPVQGSRRVLRGGAFGNRPLYVRAATRYIYRPDFRNHDNGFRLARTYDLSP